MIWILPAVAAAWLAFGPWAIALAIALVAVPRVRWWMREHLHVTRRQVTIAAATIVVSAGLIVVVPDGWLRIPPGGGLLATPAYVGRPAVVKPIAVAQPPANPYLAPTPVGDGPLGQQPQVDTAWFGLEHCPTLAFDGRKRVVTVCHGRSAPSLHVVDPEKVRKLASMSLPDPSSEAVACSGTPFFLDAADRAVLATAQRSILAVLTADGAGEPDLTVDDTWDLQPYVPSGDCVVALVPDWSGRIWWASRAGLVGTIDVTSGAVAVHDLGEDVVNALAADETGVYVVTDEALHKLIADPAGLPVEAWRSTYDRGKERKPGQRSQGSGTSPTLLSGGVVAIADNAEPAMHVVFYAADSGQEICRRAVFGDDKGATRSDLVSVGSGVLVVNTHGHRGLRSTVLGRTGESGIERVDVADGECVSRWASELVVPDGDVKVSWTNGLVYAWTKRPTLTGVSAWYATAIDVETGRAMWSVRAGTGMLFGSRGAALSLGPDGSLWGATVAGLVRVRDRSDYG